MVTPFNHHANASVVLKRVEAAGCNPCLMTNSTDIELMTEVSQRECPSCGTLFDAVQQRNGRTSEYCSKKCYHREYGKRRREWAEDRKEGGRSQLPDVAPVCSKCQRPKELVSDASALRGIRWRCTACRKTESRSWYAENKERVKEGLRANYDPEAARDKMLQQKYGLNSSQYNQLLQGQGGGCAICGERRGGGRWDGRLHVDHCHEGGHVRGLLCGRCNVAIGLFNDNQLLLQQASAYLNGNNRSLVSSVLHCVDEGHRHRAG